jgi:hypothetical protein
MRGPAGMAAVAARDDWNDLPRTDYRALAQELVGRLSYYVIGDVSPCTDWVECDTCNEVDMCFNSLDHRALVKAKAAGLEVP